MTAQVTHYEVLGVARTATSIEIRKAWVSKARQHHPDVHAGRARDRAEELIREVNEAWHVLGDQDRRADYDRMLDTDARAGGDSFDFAEYGGWQPYREGEAEVDPRLLSDQAAGGSKTVPRWITLAPIGAFLFGIFVFAFGLLLDSRGVLALGIITIAAAAGGFVLMPLVVMSRAEKDPNL